MIVEIREQGKAPRQVDVTTAVDIGREGTAIVLGDPSVSRRHLALKVTPAGLTVIDLGSSYGTAVNGIRIQAETLLKPGDVVRLGTTDIVVPVPVPPPTMPPRRPPAPAPHAPVTAAPPPASVAATAPVGPAPAAAAPNTGLVAVDHELATVLYRPGTAGEAAAGAMAGALRRAKRRLEGFVPPGAPRVRIFLVDPFPDPGRPGEMVAAGTIVDVARGEAWMVVSAESPAEPPERSLVLIYGAAVPAADDVSLLVEGWALELAGAPNPNPMLLEQTTLPPLGTEGEMAGPMAQSFVRYLLEREPRETFVRLLTTTEPGRLDSSAQQLYGAGLESLEQGWHRALMQEGAPVKVGQFARLALRYLRPHARRESEMFVYMLAGLAFTMVFPFAFRRLIDTAIPSGHFSQVVTLLGWLGAAFVISLLAGLRRAYLSAYVSGAVVRQIRVQMFDRLQVLEAGWFHQHQQGDVLSRLFSDVGALEAGLSQTLREGVFQMLSLVVSAIVLLILNPLLGVVVLIGAPLVAIVYKAMAKGAQKRSTAVQEQISGVLAVSAENYGAQPVVKAFGLENRERERFGRASDRLFAAQVRLQLFGGLFGLSVNMIVTALRLFVLGLGAYLILHGHLTVGGLVAFMSLMGEVLSPVTALTGIGQQIQQSTGALVRINEVLDSIPAIADPPGVPDLAPLHREIRLSGVGFSYTPERRTLDGVDAVIPAGSRVAFVGPTGAGKSSVLQLLMRFYDADEGAVLFDGLDVRQASLASLRSQLGVVFQDTFLFDASIRENIAMVKPGATDAEIEAAARAAELHDFVASLPRGYDTPVGERGGRLSGGQRQRLALARALLRDPRVLLLDEATSALDPRTERLIADTLERVAQGRTTISVTHRLTSVVDYDRIFVVVAGKIVEQGTHAELVRLGGTYSQLWSEQTGAAPPAEAPLDLDAALARLPLFASLDGAGRQAVAARMQAADLAAGARLPEGGGGLVLVRRGRARVLSPAPGGELAATAELGPGDAFGLAALLGQPTGSVLEAVGPLGLLTLAADALSGLAATYPVVGATLTGRQTVAGPAGGQRLTRLTLALPAAGAAPFAITGESEIRPPSAAAVARATAVLPRVPQ